MVTIKRVLKDHRQDGGVEVGAAAVLGLEPVFEISGDEPRIPAEKRVLLSASSFFYDAELLEATWTLM